MTLNFGHSETLQPMIAALGLYDDGRLLHVGFILLAYWVDDLLFRRPIGAQKIRTTCG